MSQITRTITRVGEERDPGRLIGLGAFAAALITALSLLLAGAAGSPYLSADRVNGWIVVFAIGLLGLLIAIPFALERRLRERLDDPDSRWERAMLVWGAVAGVVLAAAIVLGSGSGFSGSSLAGTVGLVATIEAGIVVFAIGTWLLAN